MWVYQKTLEHPVDLKKSDPNMARLIMTQLGGPNGELAAAIRYLQQRYTMPTGKSIALLTDIGTEEMAHVEIISAILYQLTKDCTPEELKADMCQIAHHGQAGATLEVYKTINPKICLWPTTEWIWNNVNGNLKTEETRGWIESLNVEQNILAFEGVQQVEI